MTDRELLELAAKAAGITGEWTRWHQAYGDEWVEGLDCGGRFLWNPLAEDGDAFRLAVKLHINVNYRDIYVLAEEMGKRGSGLAEAYSDNHHYAATRRAIVRAAAEIGKATGETP